MNEITRLKNSEIAAASTADLKKALTAGLTISAKQLAYLALIWRELENRGENLSALKSGLALYLPLIADDKLDPEAVVRFAGQKNLLTALMSLSIDEQRKLVAEDKVPFVTIDNEANRVVEARPLLKLSAAEVRQVFHDGKIQSEDEQYRQLLISDPKRRRKSAKRRIARKITFEEIDGIELLSVGGKRVKIDTIVEALAEHNGIGFEELMAFLNKGGSK